MQCALADGNRAKLEQQVQVRVGLNAGEAMGQAVHIWTAMSPSPSVFTSWPPWDFTGSRKRSKWSRSEQRRRPGWS